MAYTTIDDPSAYFQTALYTGNGSDGYSITNDGNSDLQPDLLWFKCRNDTQIHQVFDSNRGIANSLRTNGTDAEDTDSPNDRLTAINSDGFTLGDDGNPNTNTNTYVCWQWKANGGTTSTNTSGTNIDTTIQANTTAGFSIMTYEGTGTAADSIGHGLGVVPHMVIVKNREEVNRWTVYHHKNTSEPETDYLNLQDTLATTDINTRWNDTAPTSTVITLGSNDGVSKASTDYVCYAWTSIQGYSKFGTYVGNGNADGTFIYTGFKPAWVMVKNISTTGWWNINDHKRPGHNPTDDMLAAQSANAEADEDDIDLLSNGFKQRSTGGDPNGSGETFVYAAFAEQPFVTSGGVPCTAF